jgi:hypothetical protein
MEGLSAQPAQLRRSQSGPPDSRHFRSQAPNPPQSPLALVAPKDVKLDVPPELEDKTAEYPTLIGHNGFYFDNKSLSYWLAISGTLAGMGQEGGFAASNSVRCRGHRLSR